MNKKQLFPLLMFFVLSGILSAETIVSVGIGLDQTVKTWTGGTYDQVLTATSTCGSVSFYSGERYGVLADVSIAVPMLLQLDQYGASNTEEIDSGVILDILAGPGMYVVEGPDTAFLLCAGLHVVYEEYSAAGIDYRFLSAGLGLDGQLHYTLTKNLFLKGGIELAYDLFKLHADPSFGSLTYWGTFSIVPSLGAGLRF